MWALSAAGEEHTGSRFVSCTITSVNFELRGNGI